MGGDGRYPYPKEVWSPSGGWWTRPSNWKANTAIVAASMAFITYHIWIYSDKNEFRYNGPKRPLLSRWLFPDPSDNKETKTPPQ